MDKNDEKRDLFPKYRWEFLRRNKDFRREWNELKEQSKRSEVLKQGRWRLIATKRSEEERKFCQRWNISNSIFYPEYSYDDIRLMTEETRCTGFPNVDTLIEILVPARSKPVHFLVPTGKNNGPRFIRRAITYKLQSNLTKHGTIILEVNLLYSKSQLLKKLSSVIGGCRRP